MDAGDRFNIYPQRLGDIMFGPTDSSAYYSSFSRICGDKRRINETHTLHPCTASGSLSSKQRGSDGVTHPGRFDGLSQTLLL